MISIINKITTIMRYYERSHWSTVVYANKVATV